MSSGSFSISRYVSNRGSVYACRVQPETLAAAFTGAGVNAAATTAVDMEVSAKMSGGRREIGVSPRGVTVEFTGTVPDGYSGDPVFIPILTPTLYESITRDMVGTYLGQAIKVIGKRVEIVR